MRFYGEDKYPVSNDNSFDLRHLLAFFSAKYKSFMLKDVCNKYLFSFDKDWFCIQRYCSKYRVIGRFVSDFMIDTICPGREVKVDFDIFYTGDFDSCVTYFISLLTSYVVCESHIC